MAEDEITIDPTTKFVKIGQHVEPADMAAQGPKQRLDVNGAIRIGNTAATHNGSIRWTGTDFRGPHGRCLEIADGQWYLHSSA
ncbi:MAG: hypothetical protein IPM82_25925 [Saprospiraceae bacterium]|nr:hypothetical protein [Saprospiraceae bacterium]